VAQTRLNDLINTLRPFARSVSATVSPGLRDYYAYQGIGLFGFGFFKREFSNSQELSKEELSRLSRAAQKMKLATFVHDISRVDDLKLVRNTDIRFLNGPAIAPPCDQPRRMSCLTWEDVMTYKVLE
jgi:hypothetical protein